MLKKKNYNIVFDTNSCSFNEAVSFLVIWLLLQATTQKLVLNYSKSFTSLLCTLLTLTTVSNRAKSLLWSD